MAYHMMLDVEAVGLFGDGFAAAYVVVDDETGETVEERSFATNHWQSFCHSDDDRRWVVRNVPPLPINCENMADVRLEIWAAWERWKARDALLWADCAFPVETNFLSSAVDNFPRKRVPNSPYPLYDLSTLLLAIGRDPTQAHPRLKRELPKHDPLCDARQSARILLEALEESRRMRIALSREDTGIAFAHVDAAASRLGLVVAEQEYAEMQERAGDRDVMAHGDEDDTDEGDG